VRYEASHLLIRLISIANIVALAIGIIAPDYRVSDLLHLEHELPQWYVVSSLALPLCVAFEAWWTRKDKSQVRPVLVDILFAVTWFLVLWGGAALYSL